MTTDDMKRAAARAAADLVEPGMTVGLGSGSTALEFVRALGGRRQQGLSFSAVASSETTARLAREFDIPLTDLDERLDIAVDGADAVARSSLAAIKGLGGALTRERIVAANADRFILIVDETKIYDSLEESFESIPIPVAVVPFGWNATARRLAEYGQPSIRKEPDGSPYRTDDGNFIVDLRSPRFSQLSDLGADLKALTGVVDHGLFLDLACSAIIGTSSGTVTLERR